MPDDTQEGLPLYFRLFNEVAIIAQLSRAMFEMRLPDGLLVSHFSVVNHLIRVTDGQTPLDLARAFQVPKTTMTHTLAGLEAQGLVETRPNPRDKRSKQVWLTEKGRIFRDTAVEALAPELEWLAGEVPADGMAELVAGLEQVRKLLDARRDGSTG
ncbi:MAG: MarR family transcriptional regulator [Pseudomonadota bacterium]